MKVKLNRLIPLAAILFLSLFMETVSTHFGKILIKTLQLSPAELSSFKMFSSATGFITTASFLGLSYFYKIEKIVKVVFSFTLCVIPLFFFYIIDHYEAFCLPIDLLTWIPFISLEQQVFVSNYWMLTLIHGLASLWPSGIIILLYGYMNEYINFSIAAKYYPLFGVLGLLLNIFVNPFLVNNIFNFYPYYFNNLDIWHISYGALIFMISSFTLLLFLYLFKNKTPFYTQIEQETNGSEGWKYICAIGGLIGMSGLIIIISKTVWKYNATFQFPSPEQYTQHLNSYGTYSSLAGLVTLGIMVFMSFCLEERLGKAWKNFYYAIALMTLILGTTFFILFLNDPSISNLVVSSKKKYQSFPMRTITMISAGYQILLSSIAYPVILSLKEIAIVQIKKRNRFQGKLVIDLLFIKGFLIVGTLIVNTLLIAKKDLKSSFAILAGIFFTCCILRLFFIYFIGKRIPTKQL